MSHGKICIQLFKTSTIFGCPMMQQNRLLIEKNLTVQLKSTGIFKIWNMCDKFNI